MPRPARVELQCFAFEIREDAEIAAIGLSPKTQESQVRLTAKVHSGRMDLLFAHSALMLFAGTACRATPFIRWRNRGILVHLHAGFRHLCPVTVLEVSVPYALTLWTVADGTLVSFVAFLNDQTMQNQSTKIAAQVMLSREPPS